MDDFAVLVLGEDGEYGGPTASDLVPAVDELASRGVNVGVRLEPAGKSTTASTRRALDEIPQEEPLVRVTTETKSLEVKCVIPTPDKLFSC
jgi:hypothetical protein